MDFALEDIRKKPQDTLFGFNSKSDKELGFRPRETMTYKSQQSG